MILLGRVRTIAGSKSAGHDGSRVLLAYDRLGQARLLTGFIRQQSILRSAAAAPIRRGEGCQSLTQQSHLLVQSALRAGRVRRRIVRWRSAALSRGQRRVDHGGSAMTVARGREARERVVAEQRDAGGMDAVADRE